jgi:nicotinamide phosphoribosyltransferase
MCAGGRDSEFETYERLITEIYPNGMISIVSDTWDFWSVLTDILPKLKDKIMSRNGKVVIRPDSGDPVDIVCGNDMLNADDPAHYGAVEVLWNIFGGKINEKGYKELDSHIGLIYGDSITIDRAEVILAKLEAKGFSSGNIVFGIGSYTMQYVTRDTLGFAVKATSVVIDGERKAIFKDPKTGSKKSHKGLLMVDENFVTHEMVTEGEEKTGMLKII